MRSSRGEEKKEDHEGAPEALSGSNQDGLPNGHRVRIVEGKPYYWEPLGNPTHQDMEM